MHAHTRICHGDAQTDARASHFFDANVQFDPAGTGKFDSVAQQIEEDLFDSQTVADENVRHVFSDMFHQIQMLFGRFVTHHRARTNQQLTQAEGAALET